MPGRSRAQQEMIDAITAADESQPLALLYLTHEGANMKLQAGPAGSRVDQQLTMAATYLLFLEDQLEGDLEEVADRVASTAAEMRDDEDIGEAHWGGDLDPE